MDVTHTLGLMRAFRLTLARAAPRGLDAGASTLGLWDAALDRDDSVTVCRGSARRIDHAYGFTHRC